MSPKTKGSGTTLPETKNAEIHAFKNKGLEGENNTFRKPIFPSSKQRRRTLKKAREEINKAHLPPERRRSALARIHRAKQPVAEAKRIVQQYRTDRARVIVEPHQEIDLSDVQELRVKLIRRDKGIWSPHTDYLARMERKILAGEMTVEEFKKQSLVVLRMKPTLSKHFRKAECDV